jgi:hypothetical protein
MPPSGEDAPRSGGCGEEAVPLDVRSELCLVDELAGKSDDNKTLDNRKAFLRELHCPAMPQRTPSLLRELSVPSLKDLKT